MSSSPIFGPRLNVMAQGGVPEPLLGTAAQRRLIRDPALRHDTTWALPYWCADVPHLCLKPIPSHASAGGPGSILAKRPPQAAWD
jgi:hypothetical protein